MFRFYFAGNPVLLPVLFVVTVTVACACGGGRGRGAVTPDAAGPDATLEETSTATSTSTVLAGSSVAPSEEEQMEMDTWIEKRFEEPVWAFYRAYYIAKACRRVGGENADCETEIQSAVTAQAAVTNQWYIYETGAELLKLLMVYMGDGTRASQVIRNVEIRAVQVALIRDIIDGKYWGREEVLRAFSDLPALMNKEQPGCPELGFAEAWVEMYMKDGDLELAYRTTTYMQASDQRRALRRDILDRLQRSGVKDVTGIIKSFRKLPLENAARFNFDRSVEVAYGDALDTPDRKERLSAYPGLIEVFTDKGLEKRADWLKRRLAWEESTGIEMPSDPDLVCFHDYRRTHDCRVDGVDSGLGYYKIDTGNIRTLSDLADGLASIGCIRHRVLLVLKYQGIAEGAE